MAGLSIDCIGGNSASRRVLLGFAPASTLHALSFADVLDEAAGRGYQRRFNSQHSLDFRRYIQRDAAATIPLTFNLRPPEAGAWRLVEQGSRVRLVIPDPSKKVLAQVDCQHRLGHLADVSVELPFMTFIGLSEREEMEVFRVINSKAKGLSNSLLDFHDAQLSDDLGRDRPELFIALYLKNHPNSPWYHQLDLGGSGTSGMSRRASLRTVQKAIKRFLHKTKALQRYPVEVVAQEVLDFWAAVALVLSEEWRRPRRNLITKGIGVYALMDLAAEISNERRNGASCDQTHFAAALADFAPEFDWSSDGPLKGLGGEGGVTRAIGLLREARYRAGLRAVSNG